MNRIAITTGDPNGIGPELVLKALAALSPARRTDGTLAVFGPAQVLHDTAAAIGLSSVLSGVPLHDVGGLPPGAHRPGQVCAEAGASTVAAAGAAIAAVQAGRFDAVVAAPHHETAIHQAGIPFSGYASLVERVCGLPPDSVFVLLVGGGLRIVHATLHESVAHALARLTPSLVERAARAGAMACTRLGVPAPRIALFGLNPHASEGGLFGDDDARVTQPAAERLRAEGLAVDGPTGGDVLLATRAHDLYVAMFHDQGHIPIKLLAPQAASALSVGGDVLVASVAHGSAMDIAGRNLARPDALLRSLALLGVPTA
jgi:4-hydroxythreonine-4-phosphate dehydrogenase/1,2-dihydroxy-3,5-cyclohexadiene-1,4-dicarboxylate dehydrogenase